MTWRDHPEKHTVVKTSAPRDGRPIRIPTNLPDVASGVVAQVRNQSVVIVSRKQIILSPGQTLLVCRDDGSVFDIRKRHARFNDEKDTALTCVVITQDKHMIGKKRT